MKPSKGTIIRFSVKASDGSVLVADLRSEDMAVHHAKLAAAPVTVWRTEIFGGVKKERLVSSCR